MFKTERVPVTLFKSTDEGAPQLTNTLGSLKTVLKACLVTGYGEKQPLGWEAAYEDETHIAMRSTHEKSSKCWFSVNAKYVRAAEICGYESMSAKGKGVGRFGFSGFNFLTAQKSVERWVLIGNERGFVFMSEDSYAKSSGCAYLYFGDFPSIAAKSADCILIKKGWNNSSVNSNYGVYSTSGNYGLYDISKGAVSTSSLAIAKSYDGLFAGVGGGIGSAGYVNYPVVYPNPVSQGFSAFECFIYETVNIRSEGIYSSSSSISSCLRGMLPGLFKIPEQLSSIEEFTIFENLDASGDRFLKFYTGHGSINTDCFLVNCTAWEMSP